MRHLSECGALCDGMVTMKPVASGASLIYRRNCVCVFLLRESLSRANSALGRQVLRFRLDPYYPSKQDWGLLKSVPEGGFADWKDCSN